MNTGLMERQHELAATPQIRTGKGASARAVTLPRVPPAKRVPTPVVQAPIPAAAAVAPLQPAEELDQMLRRDPNTGAMHGLRFALLLNAGLALSGLLAWEVWSLLAL